MSQQRFQPVVWVLVADGEHAREVVPEAVGAQATAKVVGSMTKDYAWLSDHELSPHLVKWWLAPPAAA